MNKKLKAVIFICVWILLVLIGDVVSKRVLEEKNWDIVDARIVSTEFETDPYTTNGYTNYKLEFLYKDKVNHATVKCNYSDMQCKGLVGKYIKVYVEPKLNAFDEYSSVEIADEKPFTKK